MQCRERSTRGGVSRTYRIVSAAGTQGTAFQRLLVFTTARRKAPDALLALLLARYGAPRRAPREPRTVCVHIQLLAPEPPSAPR